MDVSRTRTCRYAPDGGRTAVSYRVRPTAEGGRRSGAPAAAQRRRPGRSDGDAGGGRDEGGVPAADRSEPAPWRAEGGEGDEGGGGGGGGEGGEGGDMGMGAGGGRTGVGGEDEADGLASLTVPQLKERLRGEGLRVGGRKAELVSRLRGALQS